MSHCSGGKKSKILAIAGLVPSESCEGRICPGLSLSSPQVSSQHPPLFLCHSVQISSYKCTSQIGLGPQLQYDFILTNYICNNLVSKWGHVCRWCGGERRRQWRGGGLGFGGIFLKYTILLSTRLKREIKYYSDPLNCPRILISPFYRGENGSPEKSTDLPKFTITKCLN